MIKNRRITPEGTRDLLFEECLARREVESRLSGLFTARGFSEVMTPGIEFYDVFHADSMAIPTESMYKLSDNKGRLLVMRPDSTMPIARLVSTRLRNVPLPVRLYYAQDVFRLHHGLNGHSDQQFQAGVELVGAAGIRADLEMLSLAAASLRACGCGEGERPGGDFRIEIGHVGLFHSLAAQLEVSEEEREAIRSLIESKSYAALGDLLDALPPSPAADGIRRLPRLFGGEEVLAAARPLCASDEMRRSLDYLAGLYRSLCELGLGGRVMIDLGLVHSNEYYTGVIFRGYVEGSGEPVISGGRYDSLLRQFGPDLPATGFVVNVDALTGVMLARSEVNPPKPPEALVYAAPGREAEALQKAEELTAEGVTCEFGVFDTLEQSMAYAAGRRIAKVIAIGESVEVYEL